MDPFHDDVTNDGPPGQIGLTPYGPPATSTIAPGSGWLFDTYASWRSNSPSNTVVHCPGVGDVSSASPDTSGSVDPCGIPAASRQSASTTSHSCCPTRTLTAPVSSVSHGTSPITPI